jgi:multidrug efflux pump
MEQENRMGTDRISSVLIKMGIPVILSMVLQAMYNIVDSMFVARMPDRPGIEHAGELAVNALTLSFPIQMLMIAFGIGTGVGMGAMLSRLLGSGEKEKASRTAGNGIFLAIVIYLVFLVFAFVGIRPYLLSQSRDETVLGIAQSYLFICTALGLFSLLFAIYEKMLQSTGKTIYSTVAQICGALTNIVLDPIMIYGLFGLPAMGVDGAAYATVIGQFVSFLIAFILQVTKNKEIPSGFRYLRPDRKLIGGIYSIGVSAIIMQALMSFMTYGVNIIFGAVSANAVTAYGIFYKIQQFVYFAGFGLRDSITPLISYNYGKGSYTRVKEGMKWGIIDTTAVMMIGIVILQFFTHPLARFFGLTAETERLCVLAMRIISTGFIFAGINIASQGIFQALLSGNSSLIVSFLRLLVIPLPLAYAFTRLSNAADVMWWAFPIGEAVACVAAVFLMRRICRLRVVPMKEWGSPNRSV